MAKGKTAIATTIDTSGAFFTYQPGKTFRQNVRVLMADIAREGEADVKAQLLQGQAARQPMRIVVPDRVSDHVVGRVKSLRGKPWALNAVISVNNSGLTAAQGRSLMAAAASIERRTGIFRRTSARLRKANKINAAELLRRIA